MSDFELKPGKEYRIKGKRGKWKCIRTVPGGGWFVRTRNKEWGNIHRYRTDRVKKA